MDSSVPEGVTVHDAGPFSLMGRMAVIPVYQSGDWVNYGGMLFKPSSVAHNLYGPGRDVHYLRRHPPGSGGYQQVEVWTGVAVGASGFATSGFGTASGATIFCS